MSRLGAVVLVAIFVALISVGYWLRFRAPMPEGWRDASGGLVYVVLWTVLAGAFAVRARAWKIAGSVTAVTCALEFGQLWHPAWLEAIRATLPGRLVLGTTFGWSDFPPYFIGGLVGWLVVVGVRRTLEKRVRQT